MSGTPAPHTNRRPHRLRAGAAGIAAAAAVALCGPLVSAPAMSAAEPLVAPDTLTIPAIPYDSELAAAVRMLKDAGVDRMALDAAQAIITSVGQLSADQVAARGAAAPAAGTDPMAILRTLGVQPLSPSVAPFCAAPTADNPLGLVTAGAGAVPGPWPMATEPLAPLQALFGITMPKLNLVDDGQTAYAFVPAEAGTASDGKMQVAWFNVSTMQGGFADLEPVTNAPVLKLIPLLSGVRLTPVKTGNGTVLSAVYGTATNGGRTCYFLPAVGIVEA